MAFKKTVASLLSVAWIAVAVHAETVTVTNTDGLGTGSLAAAIEEANSDRALTTIVFDIPGGGNVNGAFLPEITTPVIINGNNAGGEVVLAGNVPNGPGGPSRGLVFNAGSDNSKVSGISTERFLNAIEVNDSRVTITNSTFKSPYARAIKVDNGTGTVIQNNTFEGDMPLSTVIENSTSVAFLGNTVNSGEMRVNNSMGSVIGATGGGQGNVFNGNGTEAAVVFTGSNFSRFMNNTITNQPAQGVAFNGINTSDAAFNTFSNNKKGDVVVNGGGQNRVFRNTITGDALAHEAGILINSNNMATVTGNVLDGARITVDGSQKVVIGGALSDGNTIKNDPFGFSGSGAVVINSSTEVDVINNAIIDNASHGVLIDGNSVDNSVYANRITGNGRSGIKAVNGDKNSFSQNVITGQNAAAGGGVNSISLVGSANNQKAAPVITSVVREGNEIHISGTTNGINDKVEIFVSSESDKGLALMTDAAQYATVAFATDTSWSASFAASDFEGPAAIYLTATATDAEGNTSELCVNEKLIMNDGISGADAVAAGVAYSYEVEDIPGVSYQWWLTGDAEITSGAGSSKITAVFNTSGSVVPVNVGYSDPAKGWVTKKLTVTVD